MVGLWIWELNLGWNSLWTAGCLEWGTTMLSEERLNGWGGLEIKTSHFWVSNARCSEAAVCKDPAVGSVSVLGGQPGSQLGCLVLLQSTAGSIRLFCPSGSRVPRQHPEKKGCAVSDYSLKALLQWPSMARAGRKANSWEQCSNA